VFSAFYNLNKSKAKQDRNILFIYNGLNIEDIIIVIYAKLIGYKIITDIVEDYSVHQEKASAKMKLKLKINAFLEIRLPYFIDGLVVISSYLENKFQTLADKNIPVIMIPISAAPNSRIKNRKRKNEIIIAYSGSFGKKDGLSYLIKAFNLVNKKHNQAVLRLSGTGNDPDQYLLMADNSCVEYLGYLDEEEYFEFITSSDILCMTRTGSTYANAGFPFKLGEYLATGNPVIATDVGDIKRYLVNGNDALIVQPDNIEEIANAMISLIENEQIAKFIGKNGKEKWSKYFNASVNSEKLYNWLLEL
jgi:glycosyltransferase involved in cell wall biosynthesis